MIAYFGSFMHEKSKTKNYHEMKQMAKLWFAFELKAYRN